MGISGYGVALAGAAAGTIGEITRIGLPGIEVDDIDVTVSTSTEAWRVFIAGLKNAGEIEADLLYEKDNTDSVFDALATDDTFTITFPDDSTFACSGYLKGTGIEIPIDDRIEQTISIKLSGKPTFTAAT